MFNPLLFTSLAVFLATIVHATGPGQSTAIVARNPHTNAEAFARGLPPLHPRRQGSRTWTAKKRDPSPVLQNIVLNFEDAEFTESDGPLPQLYQGINLFCPSGTCGYVRETSYPAWTANSAPNSMFFYINGYPTIAAANGGLLRLKSLYCSQAEGYVVNLLAIGTIVGVTQYEQIITCTLSGENLVPEPPTFNAFNNLPAVEAIQIRTSTIYGAWAIDDISLTLVA